MALDIGTRIKCKSWRELKNYALRLSSEGYGVEVIGFADMSDNVLTITALPDKAKEDKHEFYRRVRRTVRTD